MSIKEILKLFVYTLTLFIAVNVLFYIQLGTVDAETLIISTIVCDLYFLIVYLYRMKFLWK